MRTTLEDAIRRGLAIGLNPEADRFCTQCHREKPFADFVSPRGKARAWCNRCTARYKGWHKKTPAQRLRARGRVRRTGNGYTVFLSLKSANRKTGPIPVSVTDMKSCPTSCPLIDAGCFMINLSANNLAEADALADLRIAPVAVILPSETRAATRTPAGRKVVVCPAVTSGLTCTTCGLCAKDRACIVGFPAHGQAAALIPLRLKARR